MGITKMSLANIQGKLSRTDMKNIMAGKTSGTCSGSCAVGTTAGTCKVCTETWCAGNCYCSNGIGICS